MAEQGQETVKMLQILSDFVTMRFSLIDNKSFLAQRNRINTINSPQLKSKVRFSEKIEQSFKSTKSTKQKLTKNTLLRLSEPSVKEISSDSDEEMNFKLKFLEKISEEHFVIGNEFQLDLIKIGGIIDNFVVVEYKWSINIPEPILSLSVENKFGLIALGGRKTIFTYRYNLKKDPDTPELIVQCKHDQDIQQVRFIKNTGIYILLETKLEFYRLNWVCEKAELNKCFAYTYENMVNKRVFNVPPAINNTLNVYFYETKTKPEQKGKFGLYMQSFVTHFNIQKPQVGKMIRIYDIDLELKNKIQIFNYSKQICLIQFQNQMLAFKNGFVIDAVNTNFHKKNCFIKYVTSSRTIIHFLESTIDIYRFEMNEKVKPERIILECMDSIEFRTVDKASLFNILELKNKSYAIFYEYNNLKNTTTNNPNIQYTFSLTKQIDLYSKINEIYPKKEDFEKFTIDQLHEKCGIVKKMGLNTQQAYYELWKRSSRSSIMDFQILLSTGSYPTIEKQIEKKLKNYSMSIRQILKIYGQCLEMLRERVYSISCTVTNLVEFASCHFAIKKFEMYRYMRSKEKQADISFDQGDSCEVIMINIKDYYEYKQMSIINEFIDLIAEYLQKCKPETLIKIRSLFKYFKLIFRIYYQEILEKLVQGCKLKIIEILKVIPEILPFMNRSEDEEKIIGLWEEVSEEEKESNLFLNEMRTIDNRDKIEEFNKNIWFKRNLNINHGVILINSEEICSYVMEINNFDNIFYKFLCKLYNLKTYDQNLRRLITHIETHYELLPKHLKGKFQLYMILFEIFYLIDKKHTIFEFLKYKEYQLFRMYFQREKIEKGGFILKKIKPLYEKIIKNGKDVFNQGMYQYFSSTESTVSDLKCILNKLNNQKNEFHISSQKLYEVLINAIMQKIKIGSDADTPIDEILVYIENIPFPIHNECIMTNLEYIQQINYESDMLRKIKVNMTLDQIVKKGEDVIEKMVDYELKRHEIHKIKDYRNLKLHAYKILAEIQCRKANIYGDNYNNYSLKIFLVSIMINIEMIQLCKELLKDRFLIQEFEINEEFIESVVMFLYQWKLCEKSNESDNSYVSYLSYINCLIELLEEDNPKKQFIRLSIKYAELLTFQNGYKIQYPLFPTYHYYPSLKDFQEVFNCLGSTQLIHINLEGLFQVMIKLKKLGEANILQQAELNKYENKLKLELYQIFIIRLIEEKQVKLALENIFILLKIPTEYPEYNVVYPILIIQNLFPEVLHNTILLLSKLVSYYFYKPLELANIIKTIFSRPFSNFDLDLYLEKCIKAKKGELIFSLNNEIIHNNLKKEVDKDTKKNNDLVEWSLNRVLQANDIYKKNYHLAILYRIMCHHPLVVSKWIWCKKTGLNVKTMRSFISFMSLEMIFDTEAIIAVSKQIFEILNYKYTHNIFFTEILRFKDRIVLNDGGEVINESDSKALQLIKETILIFDEKLKDVKDKLVEVVLEKAKVSFVQMLLNPDNYINRPLSQYIFSDADDGYEKLNDQLSIKARKRGKLQVEFDRHAQGRQISKQQSDGNRIRLFDQIPIPSANRLRKNSQYFPQMMDVEQNFKERMVVRTNSLSNLYLSQQQQDSNTINERYPQIDKIVEESGENFSSLVVINIHSPENSEKGGDSPIPSMKLMKSESLWTENEFIEKRSQDNLQKISDKSSDNDYQINIADTSQHVSPHQMMDNLYSTQGRQNGNYDLTLLKIESKKDDFKEYLVSLLDQIYINKMISYQKRIQLIVRIASEYNPSHFCTEIISLFDRMSKFRLVANLPFNIIEMFPINLLFSIKQSQIFIEFRKKIQPYLNNLNVFLVHQFVCECFTGKTYGDDLLMDFILQKITEYKDEKKQFQQQRCEQIVLSIMEYMNDGLQRIDRAARDMQKAGEEECSFILRQCINRFRVECGM